MPKEFVNAEEVKVERETELDLKAKQRIEQVANRLAGKPAETEKKFDKENSNLFTK